MKVLSAAEAYQVLCRYTELRVSDIPVSGMILEASLIISANREGEVTLVDLSDEESS